jgi:hypothetical protein
MSDSLEELLQTITSLLEEVRPSELQVVFGHWGERVSLVLENNGDDSHG